ncbi:MAG TPA: alpha/beta hydrolase [Solirubrobacteraceae bacterium]|nr:alpha/beta hydrolase [Solirubrobacteraceae bacterium]
MDWQEHLRWVEVDGSPVNVLDAGEGPPLLFVHGHSGRWANWMLNIPHFARTRRVIAPDLPGFGHSPMPDWRISIENYGRFLVSLLDALEVSDPVPVVGNSMGGFVSAELAIKDPGRVQGLVLVTAAGLSTKYLRFSEEMMRAGWFRAFARAVNSYAQIPDARVETMVRRPRLRHLVLSQVVAHPRRLSPTMAAEMIRGSGRPAAPFATDALVDYDIRDDLPNVSCPALIVWGEKDRVVGVEAAEEYRREIPHAKFVMLEDTGHVPMIERPEEFNELLDEFLAGLESGEGAERVSAVSR